MNVRVGPTPSDFFRRCKLECSDFSMASLVKSPLPSVCVGINFGVNDETAAKLFCLTDQLLCSSWFHWRVASARIESMDAYLLKVLEKGLDRRRSLKLSHVHAEASSSEYELRSHCVSTS